MDLYSPAKLRGMDQKALQECRYAIDQEIQELEATTNRSSLQELGLRNLRASFENATAMLDRGHGGAIRGKLADASNLEFPGQPKRRRESDAYMTFQSIDGTPVYAVGKGQQFADIPGAKPCDDPYAVGSLIRAALTGNRHGLSAEVSAALSESVGTQGGYNVPSVLSSTVIDLARANSVLVDSGMVTVNMTADNLTIARVTEDPEFSEKIENDEFAESSIAFGAIAIYPKMVGCLIRASLEVIEDAPNFPQLITQTIANAFAASIDNMGLNGTGAQRPRGIFSFEDIADTDVATADFAWTSVSAAALAIRNRNHEPNMALMSPTREHNLMESIDLQERWLGPPPSISTLRMHGDRIKILAKQDLF